MDWFERLTGFASAATRTLVVNWRSMVAICDLASMGKGTGSECSNSFRSIELRERVRLGRACQGELRFKS